MKKTVLVLGASTNPARFSNIAIHKLLAHHHTVFAVGNRETNDFVVPIHTKIPENIHVDTVTLYLNPGRQAAYEDQILALKPARIIFNPGTENHAFAQLAQQNGIHTVEDCTLVMLNSGAF
ncbi:MAG: hypothetical protein FD155_1618 [Bacteroidetes bacterium]|jgi:uncharacterized protein|nr:MAG: hypothetical protein FD155_1618 [Bacteroidota bacterium]